MFRKLLWLAAMLSATTAAFAADPTPAAQASAPAPASASVPAPAAQATAQASAPAVQPEPAPQPVTLEAVAQVVNNQGQAIQQIVQGVATRQDASALALQVVQLQQRVAQLEQAVAQLTQQASPAHKTSPAPQKKR